MILFTIGVHCSPRRESTDSDDDVEVADFDDDTDEVEFLRVSWPSFNSTNESPSAAMTCWLISKISNSDESQ